MTSNPLLGVLFHWIGGFASASFYLPFRSVRTWAWETAWLVGGLFSWILAPLIVGALATNDLVEVLKEAPWITLFWCYLFGVLWGFGGLTFGLTIRYLGMSLGTAIALGYCAAFGTLVPPIFNGTFRTIMTTPSGLVTITGVAICLCGIAIAGMAGVTKEKEMSIEQKTAGIKEFNFKKGLLVGTFCGVMSACFSYGLAVGEPIRVIALRHGTSPLWQGLPVLVIVLLGGFTTNLCWCVTLNVRNGTLFQYFQSRKTVPDCGRSRLQQEAGIHKHRLLMNYVLCASAGVIWYMQFFFYTMGETQMGSYRFSSWTLHMASIILFGSMWGLALKEWRGAGVRTKQLLGVGLGFLLVSTAVVGYGNFLANSPHEVRSTTEQPKSTR